MLGHVARVLAPPWLPPLAEVPESTYRDSFAGAKGKASIRCRIPHGGRISRIRRDGERVTKRRDQALPERSWLVASIGSASRSLLYYATPFPEPCRILQEWRQSCSLWMAVQLILDGGQFRGIIGGDYGLTKVNAT